MAWRPDGPLLAGRTALVTGAARGIGWEVARTLAANGADVALGGRSDPAALAAQAAALADEFGVRALAVPGDVADPAAVNAIFATVWQAWKRLDVLVNNAGVLEGALIGMIGVDLIDRVLATNTRGAILVLQAAARMMARRRAGSIITMTSIIGTAGDAGQAVYSASKAALLGLTASAAKELAPQGIRVNAIAPGYIDTDLIKGVAPALHEARVAAIGLGRIGTPADVAGVALFLASDLAGYVTGQVVGVDGGLRL
ncbi:MAG: SDR family oxidoreductase [Kofleriaceae bacterium]